MRKSILTILCAAFVVLSLSLSVFAQESITLKGTIIDNKCAEANKADLSNFVKMHTKECALMPECAASGYALYTDEKILMKFDQESNAKVAEFLKKPASTLNAKVVAKQVGNELSLVSIENAAAEAGKSEGMMEKGKEGLVEKGKEKMMEQGAKDMMKGSKPEMPAVP
jgi:hypothetical protein